ncbi:MAG: exodeoxyribonuclease VII small subunit [Candidatus Sulfobium sp.]|jgi:exodeoxyribonuclease VII small subunit
MSKSRQISYSQALNELEKIIGRIESEETDIDVLAEKVKRAAYLIKVCREKLRSTGEEVGKALSELEESSRKEETPAGGQEEETDGY